MRTALLLLVSIAALAEPAPDVLNVFSETAEALVNDDPAAFLDAFDRNMPEYAALRSNVEALLAAYEVTSTIEVVTNSGDNDQRTVELDWLLITSEKSAINSSPATRRRVVKCRLGRRGKRWKITALEPVDFFKY